MNNKPYKIPLKVSNVKGRRVWITVQRLADDKVKITSEVIPNVKIDNPKFSKDGRIFIIVDRNKYKETKHALTKYLESLYLKELGNENIHTSVRTSSSKSGNAKKNQSGTDEKNNSGEGSSSGVHISAGRDKQTESNRQES